MADMNFVQVPPDSTGKKLMGLDHLVEGETIQVPMVHVTCPTAPDHVMLIDARGQAYTRSAEGSPTIDAWGNARVAEQNMLSAYDFSVNGMDDLFSDIVTGAGVVAHDPQKRCISMSVDANAGSVAQRITNRYHYCLPGIGINCIFSIMAGDAGKVGNRRMFGYGDDKNGLFFMLDGNGVSIVVRSNATDVVSELIIPQADWNTDSLDGSGISKFALDPTKIQLMFIDFCWLGAGIARFGCFTADGARWVAHVHAGVGDVVFPYMATGSLPIYFENSNSQAVASGSDFYIYGATVYNSSVSNFTFWRFVSDSGAPRAVTTNTPLLSLKSKLLIEGGLDNRVGLYPETLTVFVSGGSVLLKVVDDAVLVGDNWVDEHDSTSLVDRTATSYTDGVDFVGRYLGPGTHEVDLSKFYELNDEGYCVTADRLDSYVMTVAATKIDGTTVNVACAVNFRELR